MNGDALTVGGYTTPVNGSLLWVGNGGFIYTPNTGFSGTDTFTYHAINAGSMSEAATVTIEVLPIHGDLVANADAGQLYETWAGEPLNRAVPGVLSNDANRNNGERKAILVSYPANGTLDFRADGSFDYQPNSGYAGPDTFTYRFTDDDNASTLGDDNASTLGTVSLKVKETPDIAITSFYSDGQKLRVQYVVLGTDSWPLEIQLYASDDGVTLDEPLGESVEVTEASYLTQGMHSFSFVPTFDDIKRDYYLMAKIDSGGDVPEHSVNNNKALFAGGSFVVEEADSGKTVIHYQGTFDEGSNDGRNLVGISRGQHFYNQWSIIAQQTAVPAVPNISIMPWAPQYRYMDVTGDDIVDHYDIKAFANRNNPHRYAWQRVDPFDVNGDTEHSPADALAIINFLNGRGQHVFGYNELPASGAALVDVSGEMVVSALDLRMMFDLLEGGDGVVYSAGRNAADPFDIGGTINGYSDAAAIEEYLVQVPVILGNISVEAIHIRLHAGNDAASVGGAPAWIWGGDGNDGISGSQDYGDFLDGGAGDDNITGQGGADEIHGQAGNDWITGDVPADPQFGADAIYGGPGDDTIFGGAGQDALQGDDGDDTLNGGEGDDQLDGGDGDDDLEGGNGTSTFVGSQGQDTQSVNGNLLSGDTGQNALNIAGAYNPAGGSGSGSCNLGAPTIPSIPFFAFVGEGTYLPMRYYFYTLHTHPYPVDVDVHLAIISGTATVGVDIEQPDPADFAVPGHGTNPPEVPRYTDVRIPAPLDGDIEGNETAWLHTYIDAYPICVNSLGRIVIVDSTVQAVDDTVLVPRNAEGFDLWPFIRGNDLGDGGTLDLFTQPQHGTLERYNFFGETQFLYTPNTGYIGNDSFTYTLRYGYDQPGPFNESDTTTATVNIKVGQVVTIDDAVAVPEAGSSGDPSKARFRVWLSEPLNYETYVDVSSGNLAPPSSGTPEERARAGVGGDFEALTERLIFSPGQTEKWFEVEITADDIDEYDEKFAAYIGSPIYVSRSTGVGTILDGDGSGNEDDGNGPPEITIEDATVHEPESGTATATLTVTLSRTTEKEASVHYFDCLIWIDVP